jgi:hypothetical protein
MSRTTRTTLAVRIVSGLAAGAVSLLVLPPAVASAPEGAARECVYDEQFLPRTPDAVEGWYRNCWTGR